jgi:hypothetical protein
MTEQVEDVLNKFARSAEGGLKPIVYYFKQLSPVIAGYRAQVTAAAHYRLGNCTGFDHLNTSAVVVVHEDGTTFETKNSIYVLRDVPVEE